jgi:hypothetical protein
MGATYEAFVASKTALSYGEWVGAGCPLERAVLEHWARRGRERVWQSLAKLPPLQDDRGIHLDEIAPAAEVKP